MAKLRPSNRAGQLVYPVEKNSRYNTKIKFQAVQITPPTVSGLGVANAFKNVADAAGNERFISSRTICSGHGWCFLFVW